MNDASSRSGPASSLNGAQKCAVACAALGPKDAGRILKALAPEEQERVVREILAMEPASPDVVAAVLSELHEAARTSPGTAAAGGPDFARRVLSEAIGSDGATELLARLRADSAQDGISLIRQTTPDMLAGSLRWEHPQTAAAALAHLEPKQAARVLGALDPELASDILGRIASLRPVEPELLEVVGTALGAPAGITRDQAVLAGGGTEGAARLLNLAPRDLQDRLLSSLDERDSDLAGKIRAKMFTFEDLLKIDQRGMQRVLREVETKELALALKAASPELRQYIRSNMSERAAETLEEEIEMLGPVRARDVEAAHAGILENVRRLDEEGEIIIQREGGNDDVLL